MSQVKPTPMYQPTPAAPKPKRRGLRSVSKETAKLKRETNPERAAFVEAAGTCMIEGCNKPAVECHEITRGNGREAALSLPRLQMALCRKHHDAMGDYSKWPPEKQLTQRALWELQQMVDEFNQTRGRAPTAFTLEELLTRAMFRRRPKPKRAKR